jgi:hypothetical protein
MDDLLKMSASAGSMDAKRRGVSSARTKVMATMIASPTAIAAYAEWRQAAGRIRHARFTTTDHAAESSIDALA